MTIDQCRDKMTEVREKLEFDCPFDFTMIESEDADLRFDIEDGSSFWLRRNEDGWGGYFIEVEGLFEMGTKHSRYLVKKLKSFGFELHDGVFAFI